MLNLLAGIGLLCASVLIFFAVCWGSRRAEQPFWATDAWVGNCHAPLIVSCLAFGVAFIIKSAVGFV